MTTKELVEVSTDLITYRGYPMWHTRKDNGDKSEITLTHTGKVKTGDAFHFGFPDFIHVVTGIQEQRKPKGTHPKGDKATFYRIECNLVDTKCRNESDLSNL